MSARIFSPRLRHHCHEVLVKRPNWNIAHSASDPRSTRESVSPNSDKGRLERINANHRQLFKTVRLARMARYQQVRQTTRRSAQTSVLCQKSRDDVGALCLAHGVESDS